MSQKNFEGAKYWNEVNIETKSTSKLFKINWTIEDVSLNTFTTIKGPDFYLQPNCLCSISIESYIYVYYVKLLNRTNTDMKIQSDVKFLDCDAKVLKHYPMGSILNLTSNKNTTIVTADLLENQMTSLKDRKLIIQCLLKVEGRTTTSINFIKSDVNYQENLIDDWKKMYNNPIESDITFKIGDKIIHAHKAVLLSRSEYFRKMFTTEMKEQAENIVLITDVLYPTMQKLVEFLYTGSFETSQEDDDVQEIFNLYVAADKYDVVDLRSLCGERLLSAATTGNICQILQLAQSHDDDELKFRAMDFIFFKFDVIENSNAWKSFISSEASLASEVLNFCFKRFKYTS